MKTIPEILQKMIGCANGNLHDINHFIKVWGYAKLIGELEGLDSKTQFLLEVAAIVHDIACPLCREKYGNANGKLQELEGPGLAAEFLKDAGLGETEVSRVCFLVGHHHTYTDVDGADYQILLEADYFVNAEEKNHSADSVAKAYETIFRTESGKQLLKTIYSL